MKTASIQEKITAEIINLIEKGVQAGESALWKAGQANGMPRNYKTGKPYSGVNVVMLWAAAMAKGYSDNRWLTFKQAQELGAHVRAGAKGTMGVFFQMLEAKQGEGDEGSEGESGKMIPMMKPFWLFNVADIENLPTEAVEEQIPFAANEAAEQIIAKSGAKIAWDSAQAFYSPSQDTIKMPPRENFYKPENAYAVALHELTHWTGHKSRLDRDFTGRFGSESYAFEELVAELGASFLCAHIGLKNVEMEHHASYIQSWLRVLKNDSKAIFTASKHASAAYQFVLKQCGMEDANA